jgi:hypothetical protein
MNHNNTPASSLLLENSINRLKCLEKFHSSDHTIPATHSLYLWAHNVIPNELIDFLFSVLNKRKEVETVLWSFLKEFMSKIRKITWIKRCTLMKIWEQKANITRQKSVIIEPNEISKLFLAQRIYTLTNYVIVITIQLALPPLLHLVAIFGIRTTRHPYLGPTIFTEDKKELYRMKLSIILFIMRQIGSFYLYKFKLFTRRSLDQIYFYNQ